MSRAHLLSRIDTLLPPSIRGKESRGSNPFAAVKLLRRESILHRIIPYSYREISIDRKIILSCVCMCVRTHHGKEGEKFFEEMKVKDKKIVMEEISNFFE